MKHREENPSYLEMVLDMMMAFPSQFGSEPQCQDNLFLTTSSILIGDNKRIIYDRTWELGKGDAPIRRSKEDILGESVKRSDNWEKFHKPVKGSYWSFPIFFSVKEDTLFHYENWTRRETNYAYQDIFNAFLNDAVILPDDWKHALYSFCNHLLRVSLTAYECSRYGYYLQHGGARQYWEGRFKQDCETLPRLWLAAQQILNKLNPPSPVVIPPKDLTPEFVKKTEKKIRAQLKKVGGGGERTFTEKR